MVRARDKTAQIGLWDSEVALPKHDDICLWVYEHAEDVLRALRPFLFQPEWLDRELRSEASPEVAAAFRASTPRTPPFIVHRELEAALIPRDEPGRGARGWRAPVGYGDVLLRYTAPRPCAVYGRSDAIESFSIHRDTFELLIEVKTVLPTLGELLRQLNLYATAFPGYQAVVAPDDRYADILREHGFGFLRYPVG